MGFDKTCRQISLFFVLFFLISILSFSNIRAEGYYADITIDVDSSGFVTIDGVTNYPGLLVNNTQSYTLKKQSYWLLNITIEDVFSDFVYAMTLPEDSSINYIKSSGFIQIQEDQGNLLVKGFGENESFSIVAQYQTEKQLEASSELIQFDSIHLVLIAAIILLVLSLVVILVRGKKEGKRTGEQKSDEVDHDFKGLNQRQKEIMKLLMERMVPLTQTDIQKELNLPKAAVSRNIRRLELKGLIEKEQIGMSNLIRLKKK